MPKKKQQPRETTIVVSFACPHHLAKLLNQERTKLLPLPPSMSRVVVWFLYKGLGAKDPRHEAEVAEFMRG